MHVFVRTEIEQKGSGKPSHMSKKETTTPYRFTLVLDEAFRFSRLIVPGLNKCSVKIRVRSGWNSIFSLIRQ